MASSIRQNRVAESIKRFINSLILSDFENSPAASITVNCVVVSTDLKVAKIFYSVFDSKNIEEIQTYLDKNGKSIRFKLAGHLKTLKFIPDIKFIYDDSVEKTIRLEKIFDSIKNEQKS